MVFTSFEFCTVEWFPIFCSSSFSAKQLKTRNSKLETSLILLLTSCTAPNDDSRTAVHARAASSRLLDRYAATCESAPRCRCSPRVESSDRENPIGTDSFLRSPKLG